MHFVIGGTIVMLHHTSFPFAPQPNNEFLSTGTCHQIIRNKNTVGPLPDIQAPP